MSAVAGQAGNGPLTVVPLSELAEGAIDRIAEAVWFCRWAALDHAPDVRLALDDLTAMVLSWSHSGRRHTPPWSALVDRLVAVGMHVSAGDDPATAGRRAYAARLLERAVSGVRAAAGEDDYGRSRLPMT